jgi:isoquinoline 1-oxidoreductase subunit alpha
MDASSLVDLWARRYVFRFWQAVLPLIRPALLLSLSRMVVPHVVTTPGALMSTAPITLTVNGTRRQFEGDPSMPLLWYLRDELALTGTKYGCGISQCGACTVHVNGAPVRACQRRMQTLTGTTVTTIEGLHPEGAHPLQETWRSIDVPQCGFCQSGQIMQAATLLARNTNPTDADIDAAMNGHICRCGTYPRIRAAIKAAAERAR